MSRMLKRPPLAATSPCLGAAVKQEAAIWHRVHRSGADCKAEDSRSNGKACSGTCSQSWGGAQTDALFSYSPVLPCRIDGNLSSGFPKGCSAARHRHLRSSSAAFRCRGAGPLPAVPLSARPPSATPFADRCPRSSARPFANPFAPLFAKRPSAELRGRRGPSRRDGSCGCSVWGDCGLGLKKSSTVSCTSSRSRSVVTFTLNGVGE